MGRLQNNPSIGWVHPKSTHVCPLAWGNKMHMVNWNPFRHLFWGCVCVCYAVDVASFLSANSWQLVAKENPVGFIQRIFMKKKVPNLHNNLDNNFQQVAKIKKLLINYSFVGSL